MGNLEVWEILVTDEEPTLSRETEHQEVEKETKTILIPNSRVFEVDEEWGNTLWNAVKWQKETERKSGSPVTDRRKPGEP